MLDIESFKSVIPRGMRSNVDQQLVDSINQLLVDPIMKENLVENILGFSSILSEGKYKLISYLNAVRFISYKMLGDTNLKAHKKTFAAKHKKWASQGVSDKDISAYVAGYNKTKLVIALAKQSLVPSFILNAPVFQEAINTQRDLMLDTKVSAKVRSDAADSLMKHLRPPEEVGGVIGLTITDDTAIKDLKEAMRNLAVNTVKEIQSGNVSVDSVAKSTLLPNKD